MSEVVAEIVGLEDTPPKLVKLRRSYANEKHVKEDIKKLLDAHGWFWWMPPANGFGKVGVSDITALRSGVFLAIEAKFGTNKPTPQQKMFLQSINKEDGFGIVVNDVLLPTFAEWLDLFDVATAHAAKGQKVPDEVGAGMLDHLRALTALTILR